MRPLSVRRLLAAPLACVLLLAAPWAAADPIGYAVGFNELYRVDLASGLAVRIGEPSAIGFNDVEGLAFAPDGALFAVADQTMRVGAGSSATTDFLLRINTTSGVGSLVGALPGLQGQGPGLGGNLDYGLAFTCDGTLWMSSETNGNLWRVNPQTAEITLVGNTGASLSGLAANGTGLYGVSVDPTPRLYRIDQQTGAASAIGALGVGGAVSNAGLDFDAAGVLWASLDPEPAQPGPSRLVRVDTTTGAGTFVANFNVGIGMKGLAIAPVGLCPPSAAMPVPGPSPVWLALFAALALLGARGRLAARFRTH